MLTLPHAALLEPSEMYRLRRKRLAAKLYCNAARRAVNPQAELAEALDNVCVDHAATSIAQTRSPAAVCWQGALDFSSTAVKLSGKINSNYSIALYAVYHSLSMDRQSCSALDRLPLTTRNEVLHGRAALSQRVWPFTLQNVLTTELGCKPLPRPMTIGGGELLCYVLCI